MSPDLSWTLSPGVLLGAALAGGIYVRRWRPGAPAGARRAARPRRRCGGCAALLAAVLIALVALISPLDALADQLFFAHMVQHMLLLDIVPDPRDPRPHEGDPAPVTRAVHDLERRAGALAHPAFAVVLYVGVIWAWHIPAAYDLALRHPVVHVLEHVSFLLAGSLYWWHLLSPIRARLRLDGMGPVVYMGSTKLFVGALGMGLAFAPERALPLLRPPRARVGHLGRTTTSRSPG